jgi:hypothetical protein
MYSRSSFTTPSKGQLFYYLRDDMISHGWQLVELDTSYTSPGLSGSHELLCMYRENPDCYILFLRDKNFSYPKIFVSVQRQAVAPYYEYNNNPMGFCELVVTGQMNAMTSSFTVNTYYHDSLFGFQLPEYGNSFCLMGRISESDKEGGYQEGYFALRLNEPAPYVTYQYDPEWVRANFFWRQSNENYTFTVFPGGSSSIKIPEVELGYAYYSQCNLLNNLYLSTFTDRVDAIARINSDWYFNKVPGVYAYGDGKEFDIESFDLGSNVAVKINNRLLIECLP